MSKHPLNLALRFILEILTLFGAGFWAWSQFEGWLGITLAFVLPVLLAAVWGIFAVPDDPSRSGKTVVVTPGWIRLILEMAFFGFGAWAFYEKGYVWMSFVFIFVVLIHYLISFDRVKWLIRR
jgi:hypothetical protein